MIEMHIYGIVPDEGPQVYNIAPNLIAEILDGCIPQSSSEFRDVYAAWMDRYAPGAMRDAAVQNLCYEVRRDVVHLRPLVGHDAVNTHFNHKSLEW